LKDSIFILILVVGMVFFHGIYRSSVSGILTENGTCTDGNVVVGNRTYNSNQTYAEWIRNLTNDNRPLAELICQTILNQSVTR
jgi:hypothetical protein